VSRRVALFRTWALCRTWARFRTWALAVVASAVVALAAVALAGCASSSYTPLEVGQCLPAGAGVEGRRVDEPEVVPCTDEHRYEVFAREDLEPPDDRWPGEELIDANAKRLCGLAIPEATGRPIGDLPDGTKMVHVAPTEQSWADGDREVECLFRSEESTTTTLLRSDS
jgi:Septum formation